MTGETLVHQGISWNDELFILVEGRAVVFDATRHAIHGKELVDAVDDAAASAATSAAYLCNRKKVPRKYTCKLLTHSLVYAVDAETFCDLLSRGHYKACGRARRAARRAAALAAKVGHAIDRAAAPAADDGRAFLPGA
ncbi:hypothetical protein SO694_00207022 [Aureococcus anophagefferens]|uniref:Cyclic nucleotide-binding domain-containing protein n=1 Tax=Aureococcus anophagefferens TaxID=44056 RepID=A0ABR1FNN1_AURAN